MLDRSIPFKHVIMRIDGADVLRMAEPHLPNGFRFKFFMPGDEIDWGQLECSVGEFETPEAGTRYFIRDYLPHQTELQQRLVWVITTGNRYIATANAWFTHSKLGYQPSLHWVSVHPEYQGLGLGKAVVLRAMKIFKEKDPGLDVWLHTQTWSHIAIRLYHQLGFRIMKRDRTAVLTHTPEGIKISPNDYSEALSILSGLYEPELMSSLIERAR